MEYSTDNYRVIQEAKSRILKTFRGDTTLVPRDETIKVEYRDGREQYAPDAADYHGAGRNRRKENPYE